MPCGRGMFEDADKDGSENGSTCMAPAGGDRQRLTRSASGFDGVVCVFGGPLDSGSGFKILKFSKRQSIDTLSGSTADESESKPASH